MSKPHRDPLRIHKVLSQVRSMWINVPDLRLGQLILNAVKEDQLYNIEDDKLIKRLEKLYK